jgi:hypothetical protein
MSQPVCVTGMKSQRVGPRGGFAVSTEGAGQGYLVETDMLHQARTVFHEEAGRVLTHLKEFTSQANLKDSDFGNLPESYKMANAFHEIFGKVQSDLNDLHDALNGAGERLGTCADNYTAVDQHTAQQCFRAQ